MKPVFSEPSAFDQAFKADEEGIAGECGKPGIRGVTKADRSKWQYLPE